MSAVLTDKLVEIQLSVTRGPIPQTAFQLGLRRSGEGDLGGLGLCYLASGRLPARVPPHLPVQGWCGLS